MAFESKTTRRVLVVNGISYDYFSLTAAQEQGLTGLSRLAF